jgi:plastocyanin
MTINAGSGPLRLLAAAAAAALGVAACAAPHAGGGKSAPADGPAGMVDMRSMSGAGGATGATGVPNKGDVQVRIINFTFSPATVRIRAGQTVEWTNDDSVAHTVDLSGVISNVLNRGDHYAQTFAAPGTYAYLCSIHPFMHGTVVVTA